MKCVPRMSGTRLTAKPPLSLRAERSNLGEGAHSPWDCRVAALLAMLGGRPPDGIIVPSWPVMKQGSEGDRPHAHYHYWAGPGEERVSTPCGRCRRQGAVEEAAAPRRTGAVSGRATAGADRPGGV